MNFYVNWMSACDWWNWKDAESSIDTPGGAGQELSIYFIRVHTLAESVGLFDGYTAIHVGDRPQFVIGLINDLFDKIIREFPVQNVYYQNDDGDLLLLSEIKNTAFTTYDTEDLDVQLIIAMETLGFWRENHLLIWEEKIA